MTTVKHVDQTTPAVGSAIGGLAALDIILASQGIAVPVSPVIGAVVLAFTSVFSFIQHIRAARKQKA